MSYTKSFSEIFNEIEEIKESIKSLQLYDWYEIMELVPNSKELRDDIVNTLNKISDATQKIERLL